MAVDERHTEAPPAEQNEDPNAGLQTEEEVEHKEETKQFVLPLSGQYGRLHYIMENDSVMDLHSTYVPPEFRGQGKAEALARAALDYAREQGRKVKVSCSFVEKFIEEHEEYQDLVQPERKREVDT